MGADSKIAWTHHAFNPWIGCQRVSPGCQHCYAEAQDQRWRPGATRWGPTAPRTRTTASYWRQPIAWNRAAAESGTRARVFCASLADVFEDRPELAAWRLDLFRLIMQTPSLDWLLLTKRPENVRDALLHGVELGLRRNVPVGDQLLIDWLWNWVRGEVVPPNVWLGTTVEDQRRANGRIPALIDVPARVRFLSCEPLLESLTGMAELMRPDVHGGPRVDWLIIGGESGPKARPFNVAWARALVRQGRAAGAKVFVKQLGSNVRTRNDDHLIGDYSEGGWFLDPERVEEHVNGYREDHQGAEVRVRLVARAGEDPAEWPEDLRVREFPGGAQ